MLVDARRARPGEAYTDALAGDPTSAFGGVLMANRPIDLDTANLDPHPVLRSGHRARV